MSLLNCSCPAPTAIGDITAQTCGENLDQIQKIIFQRSGYEFDGTIGKDITLLADWQTVTGAAGDTKAQITPFVYSAAIAAGDAITNGGGDNSTLNGIAELVGANASSFTGIFKSLNAASITELVAYACENDLVAYFVTKNQKIVAKEVSTGVYTGLTIQSLFIGDKTNNGFGTKDENAISFFLPDGWSKDYAVTSPVFNPITAL